MAAKKKAKKRPAKSTSNRNARKGKSKSKKVAGRKPAPKKGISKKRSAKRAAPKRAPVKAKSVGKKTSLAKTVIAPKGPKRKTWGGQSNSVDEMAISREEVRARSGGQSGDLQGLPDVAGADSESVDELVEEGNAFEADVVAGVERAGNEEGGEVRTHELPEDDVPDEYLEKD